MEHRRKGLARALLNRLSETSTKLTFCAVRNATFSVWRISRLSLNEHRMNTHAPSVRSIIFPSRMKCENKSSTQPESERSRSPSAERHLEDAGLSSWSALNRRFSSPLSASRTKTRREAEKIIKARNFSPKEEGENCTNNA